MTFDFLQWEREHELARLEDGRYSCQVCRRVWKRKPRTVCAGLPVYDFAARPPDLLTFTQLRRMKRWPAERSSPDGAYFIRKSPYRRYLYSLEQSRPWRVPSPGQRGAIAKMRLGLVARYTCQRCGYYDKSQGKSRWAMEVDRGWCASCWNRYHQAYRQQEVCQRLHTFVEGGEYIIVDSETTGLDIDLDEIVELSILHSSGTVLLNSLIRPTTLYPGRSLASGIHGLHYEDLASAPTLEEVWPVVRAVLRRYRRGMIYNAAFDVTMLERGAKRFGERVPGVQWECLMEEVSWGWGSWNENHQRYRYVSLDGACQVAQVKQEQAHRALADCRATLAVVRELATWDGHIERLEPPQVTEKRLRKRRWDGWQTRRSEAQYDNDVDPFVASGDVACATPILVGYEAVDTASSEKDFDLFFDLGNLP